MNEAVRRLREGHEEEMDAAGAKGIAVAGWDAADRRTLAFAQTAPLLEQFAYWMKEEEPDYIAQFDLLAVTGKRELSSQANKTLLSISVLAPRQDGNGYRNVCGLGGEERQPPSR